MLYSHARLVKLVKTRALRKISVIGNARNLAYALLRCKFKPYILHQSLRQEFEPPTEYQIEPMLISNVNFGNLNVVVWPIKNLKNILYNILYGPDR